MQSDQRAGRSSLPDQRTLLSWLFIGRLTLAVGILVGAGLVWTERPQESFLVSIAVVIALTFTAYGFYIVHLRRRRPGQTFLLIQALVDLVVVTTVVHFAGQPQSAFPALYVLVVAAYALLMPPATGALTAVLASALFLGDTLWTRAEAPDAAFWAQMLVFNLVFAIVAVLGHRLREAGMEQETLATELQRVRLEADDILRNIRSGVLTVDGLGRLAFINPTAERLLDLEGDALLGLPVLDQLKVRSAELWAATVAGIRSGRKISRGEGIVSHQAGRTFPIGLSTTTFRQETQEAPSVTAIFTDISDLKEVQELHARAERLESVAALSASLAHEIRNPLASIRSSVEQLARSRHADEDERFLAGLIVRESDRLSRLLSEFLDFARVRVARAERVNMADILRAAATLAQTHPDRREGVRVTCLVPERAPLYIEGDEDLLHRAIFNLALNAVQASPVDGEVRIEAGVVDAERMPLAADFEPGSIAVRVSDEGPGIPPEIRDRLFDPFFTTKPGGNGLGLAVVHRAIEAHGGLVFFDSAGRLGGTRFTVIIPRTRSGAASPVTAS